MTPQKKEFNVFPQDWMSWMSYQVKGEVEGFIAFPG
jgi:hypothetical protein